MTLEDRGEPQIVAAGSTLTDQARTDELEERPSAPDDAERRGGGRLSESGRCLAIHIDKYQRIIWTGP